MSAAAVDSSASRGGDGEIVLSLRETRLVVERLLQSAGLSQGVVFPARDFIIEAELLGLGALSILHDELGSFDTDPACVELVADNGSELTVDCHGLQSAVAAAVLMDLIAETVSRFGHSTLTIIDVVHPELLQGLTATAHHFDAALEVQPKPEPMGGSGISHCTINAVRDNPNPFADPLDQLAGGAVLARGAREGIRVPEPMWWELHHLSNLALSVDSVISRGHAGAIPVNTSGRLGADPDDDFTVHPEFESTDDEAAAGLIHPDGVTGHQSTRRER